MPSPSLPAVDVCVRGAGIVGRTLALLLARDGLRVALAGRPAAGTPAAEATPGHGDVRAYALNAAARDVLKSLRAWPEERDATPVAEMWVDGGGGAGLRFSAARQGVEALAWIVDVPALESRLADAVRFQPHVEWVAKPVPASLTVICEGKASSTRELLGIDYEVTPYAQQAIATRLECEKPHEGVARQWFADGEILAFLPLGGPGGNSVAVVWSQDQSRVAGRMALDAGAFAAELHAASHGTLGALALSGERVAWPLSRAIANRWVGTGLAGQPDAGWALAGDAAHTVHPLAGQGLNLGLADAAALARVLKEREAWRKPGDERLLRRYARARRGEVTAMALATDGLQQLFARPEPALGLLREWGMKGFEKSTWLKSWVTRQAMGLPAIGAAR